MATNSQKFVMIWRLLKAKDIALVTIALLVFGCLPWYVLWHYWGPNFGPFWDIFHPYWKAS